MSSEVENMVNQYFDGELSKGKEPILFTLLSQDEVARNYFKQMNVLKNNLSYTMEEFPVGLEQTIFSGISKNEYQVKIHVMKSFSKYFVYGLTIVFLIMSLLLFYEIKDYRSELASTTQQIIDQQKTINLLINSLPAVQVESKLNNEIIIKANL